MFDVDEIGAGIRCEAGSANVVLDQDFDFVIRPNLIVARDVELLVENGVTIGDPGFHAGLLIRFAEATGMSELESDHEIVG